MSTEQEEWRDVPGFEGFYMVSNFGNVKSLDRMVVGPWRKGLQRAKGRPMKLQKRKAGHLDVLIKKNGLQKRVWVHRLVATCFIPNPENLPIVNHIDSNPANNHVLNLEWCTQKHNVRHCHASGRANTARGERSGASRLTERDILDIRAAYANGVTGVSLAKKYGIHGNYIYDITSRKKWKHI
jgi:hypothetical protein